MKLPYLIFIFVLSLLSCQQVCFSSIAHNHPHNHLHNHPNENSDNTIRYVYHPTTGIINAKFICEQEAILKRHFYFYDDDGVFNKSIVDDGSSSDPEDMENVTERHISTFVLHEEKTTTGQPELIENIISITRSEEILSQQEMRYDSNGNKVRETHAVCNQNGSHPLSTAWQYNSENHLEAIIEGDGSLQQRRTSYRYDAEGRLHEVTKPDGVQLTYHYDRAGQLCQFTASDNSFCYQYLYDANHNIIQVEDLIHGTIIQRTYNASNQMTTETFNNRLTLSNSYDAEGRRTQCILPDGSGIAYSYDSDRLTAVHRLSSNDCRCYTHTYFYDNLTNQLTAAMLIGDLGEISYSYDTKNRYTGINTDYWSENIPENGYDLSGNMQHVNIEDAAGSINVCYAYDAQQQLVQETGVSTTTYAYDSIGNRLMKNQEHYKIDSLNQLTSNAKSHYLYDANGCLIEKKNGQDSVYYQYDALNRLIHISQAEKFVIDYAYDAFGRRLTKKICEWDETCQNWDTEKVLHYLYDGDHEIGTITAEGSIHELRILGQGKGAEIGAAVALELGQEIYAPIHNHQGSVCCLVDIKTQKVAEYYRYSAFGETQIFNALGQHTVESTLHNPWSFSSKRKDLETVLINFGKRYYDPEIGRWITPDPLGFCDGPNRYAFVHNNPIALQDLYGLFSFSNTWNRISSSLASAMHQAIGYLKHQLSYKNYIQPYMDNIAQNFLGRTFLAACGYFNQPSQIGIYGQGEFYDKVRITAINGVFNLHEHVLHNINNISNAYGGVNIHYVYYPTKGLSPDLIKSFFIKCGYVSQQARQLAAIWKQLIQEMGGTEGGGLIIHYAHSIGGTNTHIAKKFLTPEEQKMIRVIAIGSATVIPDGGFESVQNYISRRDGVFLFDAVNYISSCFKKNSNVIYVGSLFGMPFIDHLLSGSTYTELIEKLGQEFLGSHPFSFD